MSYYQQLQKHFDFRPGNKENTLEEGYTSGVYNLTQHLLGQIMSGKSLPEITKDLMVLKQDIVRKAS